MNKIHTSYADHWTIDLPCHKRCEDGRSRFYSKQMNGLLLWPRPTIQMGFSWERRLTTDSTLLLDHRCLLLFSTCLQRPTCKGETWQSEQIYKSYILQEGTRVTPLQKKTQLLHSFESCFLQETTSFRSEHKYAKRVWTIPRLWPTTWYYLSLKDDIVFVFLDLTVCRCSSKYEILKWWVW